VGDVVNTGVLRLLTFRGQEVALLSPDEPFTSGQAVAFADGWITGVDRGVVVLPGNWVIEDEREQP
jgi:hypothetical protein